MMEKNRKNYKNQEGQAVLEFLLFLPLIIILYVVIVTIGNSINGSINQQKITRGYLFNLIHNDSSVMTNNILTTLAADGVVSAGLFSVGWSQTRDGEMVNSPCYKMISIATDPAYISESCSPGEKINKSTRFIRVKTVFGLCTENYYTAAPQLSYGARANNTVNDGMFVANTNSCTNNR